VEPDLEGILRVVLSVLVQFGAPVLSVMGNTSGNYIQKKKFDTMRLFDQHYSEA
jgi:hypothetical protein